MASIKDQLTTKFSAEQNGVKLGGAVVAVLADYLENVVKVEDVGEVDEDSLEATLKEAWEAKHEVDLPSMHANKLLMWLGVTQAQVLSKPSLPPSSVKKMEDKARSGFDEDQLFGNTGPTDRERKQFEFDKQAHGGLSGLRILCLSLGVELGRVPTPGDAMSVIYGSDPRLSEMVKQARKAGLATLSKHLDAPDAVHQVSMHMSSLIREFSEMSLIEEASLLTTWWSETQAISGNDPKILSEYIKEYLKKYVGRGLPVPIDITLITRVTRGLGSGSSTAVNEALKIAKDAKARADDAVKDAAAARTEARKLQGELDRLRSSVAKKKEDKDPDDKEKKAKGKGKCFICGSPDHQIADCPERKQKEEE